MKCTVYLTAIYGSILILNLVKTKSSHAQRNKTSNCLQTFWLCGNYTDESKRNGFNDIYNIYLWFYDIEFCKDIVKSCTK